MHGHNDGYIAPYTDIEFQLTKYHNFYKMLWQNLITDVQNDCNTIDNNETCHTDGIKNNIHNKVKSMLYNKKAE